MSPAIASRFREQESGWPRFEMHSTGSAKVGGCDPAAVCSEAGVSRIRSIGISRRVSFSRVGVSFVGNGR